jgi:hypothetical protein
LLTPEGLVAARTLRSRGVMAPRFFFLTHSRLLSIQGFTQPLVWGFLTLALGVGVSTNWLDRSGIQFRFPQSQRVSKAVPAVAEVSRARSETRARDRLSVGKVATQVAPNSSYLLRTDVQRSEWAGIAGLTASGEVLPAARFQKNAETCGDWLTQVTLSQRSYELRRAHGLNSAFDEQVYAQRLSSLADQIGNEVLNYHSQYHRSRAQSLALSIVDRKSELYRFLAAPVGVVAAVALWGTGTPIEIAPISGWRLMSETRVTSKSSRLAIMSSWLGTTDFRVDLSDPTWSWYAASFSRSFPGVSGLSARISAVRPLSADLEWMGQGPMVGETVALEYQLRF